jgi:hypothetical protein
MKLGQALPLVIALAVVPLGAAVAQFGGMPGMPGSPGMPGGPGMPGSPGGSPFGARPQEPPPACQKLLAIRDEVQKHGQALQAAGQKKAAPDELCKLFKAYLAAGTKMVKGLEEGATTCGVPAEVPKQLRAQQAKESQVAKQVCDAAAQGPRQAAPSLGDALGTTPQLSDSTTGPKRGPGTFDTLEGSPLVR